MRYPPPPPPLPLILTITNTHIYTLSQQHHQSRISHNKKKLKDDLNSSSLFELSSTFSYNVYPTPVPTHLPTAPTSPPTRAPSTPPPTSKDSNNINSASSDGLLVVGAGAAAGFLLLALVGMFMLRACRQKKDDDWTDTARGALSNSVIEIGRMDESEVPETAIAVAGEWVEEGPGAEVPIAA
jgi:hypothetical protein